jgi:nicotinate-nucleotide adenylyltransferase
MPVKRIGIFGGTFDPPHLGHLILAEEIREAFDLSEVYFMPCNEPPHKDREHLTAAKHRFAMVVAATLHNPTFVASPIEVNRPGKSYSIDTVRELHESMGSDTELVFVTGLDAFLEIETWEGHEQFLDLCHVVVVSRPGHGFEEVAKLPAWIRERIIDLRGTDRPPAQLFPAEGRRIFLSDAVHIDISSTDVRDRIAAGAGVRYKVPAEVERYIRAHGLYRNEELPQEMAS